MNSSHLFVRNLSTPIRSSVFDSNFIVRKSSTGGVMTFNERKLRILCCVFIFAFMLIVLISLTSFTNFCSVGLCENFGDVYVSNSSSKPRSSLSMFLLAAL